jgi:methylphosphotriester-DNA--protein-cysteine methyltransferase
VEEFFRLHVQKSRMKKSNGQYVQEIIDKITEGCDFERLGEICASHNVNIRSFRRHFVMQVGISPKTFCRIVRINRIFKDIEMNPDVDINDLVYKYNYFDQAHFINDFKDIMGETPLSFRKKDKFYLKLISAIK